MKYANRPINFVLFGYYGFGNLGDELLCSSLVAELLRLGYKAETLRILVGADDSTARSLGIKALFRKNLFANVKIFLKTKVLLFGGGGIFQDEKNVLSCLYYLFYEFIAKICGCRIYMIGQSIGPLNTKCGKFLTNIAFNLATKVTVRDKLSKEYLELHSIKSYLHSDLVLLLNNFSQSNYNGDKAHFVLLNVRDRYSAFAELLSNKAKNFVAQNGLDLKYIAFSSGDVNEFERLIEANVLLKLPITLVKDLEHFKSEAQSAKYALGMRLHFCILSAALKLPIALGPYNPKVRSFAQDYDLPLVERADQPLTLKKITQDDFTKLASEKIVLEQLLTNI